MESKTSINGTKLEKLVTATIIGICITMCMNYVSASSNEFHLLQGFSDELPDILVHQNYVESIIDDLVNDNGSS